MATTDYHGRCPECGSPRWVAVSVNGGLTRVPQCIPCGELHSFILPRVELPKPAADSGVSDVMRLALVLDKLSHWFALEAVANEIRFTDTAFPALFRKLVAHWLVADRKLGWPDAESAEAYLVELYKWDDLNGN